MQQYLHPAGIFLELASRFSPTPPLHYLHHHYVLEPEKQEHFSLSFQATSKCSVHWKFLSCRITAPLYETHFSKSHASRNLTQSNKLRSAAPLLNARMLRTSTNDYSTFPQALSSFPLPSYPNLSTFHQCNWKMQGRLHLNTLCCPYCRHALYDEGQSTQLQLFKSLRKSALPFLGQ